MKEILKKNIKIVFLLTILTLSFFININKTEAASFYCIYTADNGNYKVKVNISDTFDTGTQLHWEAEATYLKWNGTSVDKSIEIKNFKEEYWDLWIYKEQKCPPYLLGAYKKNNGLLGDWSAADDYSKPYLTKLSNFFYTDGWAVSNGKLLSLNTQETSFSLANITKPRNRGPYNTNLNTIHYTSSEGDSYQAGKFTDYWETYIEIENGKTARVYARGIDTDFNSITWSPDYEGATIQCQSSNPQAIEIIEEPNLISYTSASEDYPFQNYAHIKPGFTFVIKAKQVTSSYEEITCTVKSSDGTWLTKSTDANQIQVAVTPSSTQNVSEVGDIKCHYDIIHEDSNGNTYNVTGIKIEATGYNDGQTDAADIGVSFYYKNLSGKYTNLVDNTVVKKDTKITSYEYSNDDANGDRHLKFKFDYEDFAVALKYDNGKCPAIYTKKKSGGYELYLTSGKDYVKAFTKSKEYKASNSTIWKTEVYELSDKTASIPIKFYESEDIDPSDPYLTGAAVFHMEGTTLRYTVKLSDKKGTEVATELQDMTVRSTDQTLEAFTGQGGGDFYSYQYYVRIESSLLKRIEQYLTGEVNEVGRYNVLTDRVLDYGYLYNEFFTVSLEEITAEGNDFDQGNEYKTDEVIDGTLEDDGVEDYIIQSGRTSELEILAGDNDGKLECEHLFNVIGPDGLPTSERNSLWDVLHTVVTAIRIGTPILLILLTMVDFTKATTVDEALPKAKKNAITRAIVAVVIFMLPSLVNLIFALIGIESCQI